MNQAIPQHGECLESELLGALAEGRLDGPERERAVRHLANCPLCRELLASSVSTLSDEGWLEPVPEVLAAAEAATQRPAPARAPWRPEPHSLAWVAAAAAVLFAVLLWVLRLGPQQEPHEARSNMPQHVPPTRPSTVTSVPDHPWPAEALVALRGLRAADAQWNGPSARALVHDARAEELWLGMHDVDTLVRAARDGSSAAPGEPAMGSAAPTNGAWRRIGRVLEASRLALLDPRGAPAGFFDSAWVRDELALAARQLREDGVGDAKLPSDIQRTGAKADGKQAQVLLDRLDALLTGLL